MRHLLITAEPVAKAALMREDSRGAHPRSDFPAEEEEWIKYTIVSKKGAQGEMILEKVERPVPDPELERIAKSSIEDLDKEVEKDRNQSSN
jgi:succinate dehydrogenase/fumarate reductase flavoprotein subunit